MGGKGKRTYIPPELLKEIENVKKHDNVVKQSDALRKIVKYSETGRTVNIMSERLVGYDIIKNMLKKRRKK